jgi:hypothetical protein
VIWSDHYPEPDALPCLGCSRPTDPRSAFCDACDAVAEHEEALAEAADALRFEAVRAELVGTTWRAA